ncbi:MULTISPECIES: hypothetical protein [Halorussus]|uniref:hypothetical protein n=1 Tax=Halorussus TaxID=1070314 RepID=UPI0020A0E226|nr:hypothetical protein [Halorussus vallis]USZ75670.1 hypothetical protein NGM07_19855 [Halorussus vallis]USZ75725.1 hypothetical protein NGM07_20135 [Halorussus vallis]USZ75743.1 hypothetical protein NGM07_00080 [Halorussus vallis]
MTDLLLYALALPRAGQTQTEQQQRQNLSKHGLLDNDSGVVQHVSSEPGTRALSGVYRGKYAEKMASELEELATAAGDSSLPLAGRGTSTPMDGYYSVEEADVRPADPKAQNLYRYRLSLAKDGTRASRRRAISTTVVQVENDLGNDQTALVGVPTAAEDVRWSDSESKQTEAVAVVETRSAELGDVDVVDAKASSFTNPTLVYDVDYTAEADVDVRVWDTQGHGSKLDGDGYLQWKKVFSTSHDFSGNPVCDNGLVRLTFDTAANSLAVEEWDSSTSTWSAVALGTSNWELAGLDVTEIGLASIEAQVRFEDPSQSPTAEYYLNMSLKRGWEWPLWTVPENETPPTPSGLQDLLAPVASGSDYDPQEVQTLVDRSEVRK